MLRIGGMDVELLEGRKDFGERASFDKKVQYRCAIRWSAAPTKMKERQKEGMKSWTAKKRTLESDLVKVVDSFYDDKISFDTAKNKALSWLQRASHSAYHHGMLAAGVGDIPMGESDQKWLDEYWFKAERGFMLGFLRDLKKRKVSINMARYRARMYANALDGLYYAAIVSCFPSQGTTVEWKLGHAEHCPDCKRLAGKHTPSSLRTTPRAGSTRCRTNCRCNLVVSYVPSGVRLKNPEEVPMSRESFNSIIVESDDSVINECGVETGSPIGLAVLALAGIGQ